MRSLKEMIDGIVALAPAESAVEFNQTWYSWGQIGDAQRSVRGIIDALLIGAETRIGILMRNRPEFIPAILEVTTADRCLVTLNTIGSDEKIAAEIVRSQVPVLIAGLEDWQKEAVRAAAAELGALGIEVAVIAGELIARPIVLPDKERWKHPAAPGVAVEMLSSGTTGAPKRIPLSKTTFIRSVADYLTYEKGGSDSIPRLRGGVQFLITPFGHIGGLGRLLMAVVTGRKSCLFERFDANAFHQAIVRHRPKVVSGPPTVLRMLLDADTPRDDLASLVAFRCGMAPLDPALSEAFTSRYGIPVLQNYGATEFGGGIAGWTMDDFKIFQTAKRGSVGRLNAGIEARAVDPATGNACPAGESGLLEVRAAHIQDGGWVRTTDIAAIDEDRFVWLKGRADNAIMRGGFKVLPDEVVKTIETHPGVAEAAVVGIADPRLGHIPVAAVVHRPGAPPLNGDQIKLFLRERLAAYQIPAVIQVVNSLPRLNSLKLDVGAVKRLFEDDPNVSNIRH